MLPLDIRVRFCLAPLHTPIFTFSSCACVLISFFSNSFYFVCASRSWYGEIWVLGNPGLAQNSSWQCIWEQKPSHVVTPFSNGRTLAQQKTLLRAGHLARLNKWAEKRLMILFRWKAWKYFYEKYSCSFHPIVELLCFPPFTVNNLGTKVKTPDSRHKFKNFLSQISALQYLHDCFADFLVNWGH